MPSPHDLLCRGSIAGGVLLLAACGGGSDASSRKATEAVSDAAFRSIAGLYDWSQTYDGELDEFYLEITDEGRLITHDYLGDAFDRGENCYERYPIQLTHDGGDRYAFTEEGDVFEVVLAQEAGGLRLILSGEDDDGEMTAFLDDLIPPAEGLSSTDFNRCANDAGLLDDVRPSSLPSVLPGRKR